MREVWGNSQICPPPPMQLIALLIFVGQRIGPSFCNDI
ncbi:hypothetical protein P3T22_005214 [Paraburkholderia sp. GAS348]